MLSLFTGAIATLSAASASLAAPPNPPGSSPPSIAAALSGTSDAAAARDQIVKDAVAKLKQAEAEGVSGADARPWHEMSWFVSGPGQVGRLYDMCTGAVEPRPKLSVGAWSWETLDPRGLSQSDRDKLVAWQTQQVIAQFGCGTVFVIGTLSSDAHRSLHACPTAPADGARDVKAFIAYVHPRAALRMSDDLTGTLVAALRAVGCS